MSQPGRRRCGPDRGLSARLTAQGSAQAPARLRQGKRGAAFDRAERLADAEQRVCADRREYRLIVTAWPASL